LASCPTRHNHAVEIADDDVAGTDLDAAAMTGTLATTRVGHNATVTGDYEQRNHARSCHSWFPLH
jgi:hypothetical protein